MEKISVFDMLKIGIGPSSSHTLGPWRAAGLFALDLQSSGLLPRTARVCAHLYGSLALTGKGHGTDVAILMGLSGKDPVTVPVEEVQTLPAKVADTQILYLRGEHALAFHPAYDLVFHFSESLPYHANGLRFEAWDALGALLTSDTYYSTRSRSNTSISVALGFRLRKANPASTPKAKPPICAQYATPSSAAACCKMPIPLSTCI